MTAQLETRQTANRQPRERVRQPAPPQRPLRILRVITRLNIGGPAIHAALLSTRLDPAQFVTCLVAGASEPREGDLSELFQGHQGPVIRLDSLRRPIRPWADVVACLALLRILWRHQPHIIHTHMAKAGTLGRVAGLLYNAFGPGCRPGARASLVHTFHGHVLEGYFSPQVSWFFITIERWLGRRTDCLIAVSPAVRQVLLRKGIGQGPQWQVIPLGLDLSILAQLPFPNGSTMLRIGMVGRLVPIKNPTLLLAALQQVRQDGRCPSFAAVIVGDGPLRPALERQAHQLGLERVVQFTGWQRNLRTVYEGLDIVCLTSWNEGTPVALIEAMAAGRAVVATDVGGVRDVLEDEAAGREPLSAGEPRVTSRGILVRAGDLDGLTAALAMLLCDAVLRRRLGEAGRAHVLKAFSHYRLIQDISHLYETLQGRGGTGAMVEAAEAVTAHTAREERIR